MAGSKDIVIAPVASYAAVQQALYLTISWDADADFPPLEVALARPGVAGYHEAWGKPGDIGVEAAREGEFVGAAFARLFTDDFHGYGYVDADTPELGIGVAAQHRRKGIGRRLLLGLAEVARSEGFDRLSLSVNNQNPAKRLYESVGYETVADDGASSVMVLDL